MFRAAVMRAASVGAGVGARDLAAPAHGIAKRRAVSISLLTYQTFDEKLALNMKVSRDWLGSHHGLIATADGK